MVPNIIGHISGRNLEEITFIADEIGVDGDSQRLVLGEMYVCVDKRSKERFLLRVSGIGYGQRPEIMKQTARSNNEFYKAGNFEYAKESEETEFWEIEDESELYNEAQCELVGFIDNNARFGPPKHLPSYNSPVRKLDIGDLDFMSKFLGDIPFGKLRSGSDVYDINVGLFASMVPFHIGIFAKTGQGKSNFIQRLIGGVLEKEGEVGVLLLEPHGEYKQNLSKHPNSTGNLVVFEQHAKSMGRQLRISTADLTVTDLMNIKQQMHWSEPQERFLREAEEKLGRSWFDFLTRYPVTLDEAHASGMPIVTVLKDEFLNTFEDTIRVTQSKLKRIRNAPFFTDDPTISDIKEILRLLDEGKVVLIDLVGLEFSQELLLSAILTSKALKKRKALYNKDREFCLSLPPISVVLEEAQNVLSRDSNKDGNVFVDVCNQGRKFGVGLLPIAQQPKKIDPQLMSQINTLFILGITDKKDFDALEEVAAKPIDKLRQEIRSLQAGEALMTSPKSPFAVPVVIDFYDDYIKTLKPKKITTPKKSSFEGMV